MKQYANPFEFQETDSVIACVGENGGTYNINIKNGFQRTVEILIHALQCGNETEDTLVYPVIYTARHSVELSLKIIIEQLWKIQDKKGMKKSTEQIEKEKREIHTHDISKLYNMMDNLGVVDKRIPIYYKRLHPLLGTYYFDKDGDAFKYESDQKDHMHMKKQGITHISINTFGEQFDVLMKHFDDTISFLNDCIEEYQLNTFTSHLSRQDIEDISIRLPLREQWKESCFDDIKNAIKKDYDISNKEFSNALNIIQKHRKFCVNIGCEIPFQTIPEKELEAYISLVCESIRKNNDSSLRATPLHLSKLKQQGERLKEYADSISVSTLNWLYTFQEMGKGIAAEYLEKVFNYVSNSKFNTAYMLNRVKTQHACKQILIGLQNCGQISYYKMLLNCLSQQGISVK